MNRQFEDVNYALLVGHLEKFDDEPVSKVNVPEDPVAAFDEKRQLAVALGKNGEPDWDLAEKLVAQRSGAALHKRAESAHPDDVVIRKLDDGDFWKNTYRNGELVEMELCYANGKTEHFDAQGQRIG
jgi:hypothetical protein